MRTGYTLSEAVDEFERRNKTESDSVTRAMNSEMLAALRRARIMLGEKVLLSVVNYSHDESSGKPI